MYEALVIEHLINIMYVRCAEEPVYVRIESLQIGVVN